MRHHDALNGGLAAWVLWPRPLGCSRAGCPGASRLPDPLVAAVSTGDRPTTPTRAPLMGSCTTVYRCTKPRSDGSALASRLHDSTGKEALRMKAARVAGPCTKSWLPSACRRAQK